MPAAAVIPAARVVVDIIEPKTFVAGLVNPWVIGQLNCPKSGETARLGIGRGQRYFWGRGKIL